MIDDDERLVGLATVMGLLTKLTAGLTLRMWKEGMLKPEEASGYVEILQELAKLYEDGDELHAAELWTVANLIQSQSPKGRG